MRHLAYALISLGLMALVGWVFYLTGSLWAFLLLAFIEYPYEVHSVEDWIELKEDEVDDK